MATKNDYLTYIDTTKKELEKNLLQVELVLDGAKEENLHLENKHECYFGKWLYAHEDVKDYIGFQQFEKLDLLHTQWHTHYAKIYQIFMPEKKGLFSKLLSKKHSQLEIDKAKAYYDDLKIITDEIIKLLEIAKRRINALSESKFH